MYLLLSVAHSCSVPPEIYNSEQILGKAGKRSCAAKLN